MGQAPATRPSLLIRLRDRSDRECWSRFVDLYGPLVYGFLRKRGVQDADAADLTQDVLISVAGAISSFDYDPSRGSFRCWLFTIVHNRLCNYWRRNELGTCGAGGTEAYERLRQQPQATNAETAQWDQAFERHLFQVAAEQVRGDFQESTWRAFWRTAVEGHSARDVAESLGISVAAVYMAKRRVTARIKEQVEVLQGDGGEPRKVALTGVDAPPDADTLNSGPSTAFANTITSCEPQAPYLASPKASAIC